jgi:YD repeat-containing protein
VVLGWRRNRRPRQDTPVSKSASFQGSTMSSIKPIREYDSNGNCIHYKDNMGIEQWYEFDSNGNCIYYKDNKGYEYWREYDSKGKEIHYKDNYEFEYWREFDSNGNCIHYRDSEEFERWFWECKETKDPIKILLLASQLHSKAS